MVPTQMRNDDTQTPDPVLALVPGVTTAGTLLVAFTLMTVGFDYFWVAFVLGFGVVLPVATGLSGYVSQSRKRQTDARTETPARTEHGEDDALAALRQRYARGELSDAEFEHRVERLLETESPDASQSPFTTSREDTIGDSPERRY